MTPFSGQDRDRCDPFSVVRASVGIDWAILLCRGETIQCGQDRDRCGPFSVARIEIGVAHLMWLG